MLLPWISKSAIGVIVLVACSCSRPYDPPEFRGAMEFVGARDVAGSEGIVRVIMTHGMCTQSHQAFGTGGQNWVGTRTEMIAEIIGDKGYERQGQYDAAARYYGTAPSPAIYRYDVNLTGEDGIRYEIKLLKWGGTFQSAYNALDTLENETQKNEPITRAKLNDQLKGQLMDDCLVDAVVYSGPRGNSLRAAYREAVCDLMGGRIGGTNQGEQGERVSCDGARIFDPTPTVIVPESLGSKVMMDALNSISGNGSLGSVRAIHLATNQIPLLSQAELPSVSVAGGEVADDGSAAFRSMIDRLRGPASRGGSSPMAVVAYNDANDLVGYPLTPAWVPQGVSLTNVLLSNAETYFGYVEHPLDAHYNTARPQVLKMIIDGSDADI